ncbi:Copper-exporting P-type ATPase B|nr:Copper-exporting P-type ATPase B [Rhodococcus kroppenstedtii]
MTDQTSTATRADSPREHGHHDMHSGHGDHVGRFRRLFWVMAVLAVPVIAASDMFAMIVGYSLPAESWIGWVSPVLGTVMFVWGGSPFLTGALGEIRGRTPGMMLLIALAITVAFVSSLGASVGILDHQLDFWWELALLIVIMLLGHWIEMRSLAQTTSALDSLAALLPDTAERVDSDGDVVTVDPAQLQVGDVVVVRPGGRVPADGVIVAGAASMDESMITGESRTVRRGDGDTVVAGTVATDSGMRIRVSATGDDTTLAGIRRLVSDAQNSTSRAQRVADIAAAWLFWFALGAAVLTAAAWTVLGSPDEAVVRTITVLVIACPHALGLAIPLVVSIATERAARGGVLIKDRLALESMRTVDTVLFDKTGTLTRGEPAVTAVRAADGRGEEDVLTLAAAAEADSEHPLARAIVAAADRRHLTARTATDFRSSPAVGVSADVDGVPVRVGGPAMLEEESLAELDVDGWRREGAIILHVVADGEVIGALKLADEIRPESRDAVGDLHARSVQVVMITGDADAVAKAVATELGVDRYFAGVRPEDKAQRVADLQDEGRKVAMVGDGVNDAPALARADVGIAIGAGTDVAIASAGVILASDDPRSVLSVVDLSRAAYRKMKQNLWWAAGYNLISVPLAAGVLAPIGFVLPMSVGAILMSLSTIIVAANAQLLRRLDLRPGRSRES